MVLSCRMYLDPLGRSMNMRSDRASTRAEPGMVQVRKPRLGTLGGGTRLGTIWRPQSLARLTMSSESSGLFGSFSVVNQASLVLTSSLMLVLSFSCHTDSAVAHLFPISQGCNGDGCAIWHGSCSSARSALGHEIVLPWG